jgi:glycosyltransferase involved in cell wall biosynthesis
VLRVSLKYSRYVVTPSPGFLSLSDYTRGYESKAVSIPHVVDLSLFNPGAGGGKIKGMLDLKGKVVLFVSSLDKSRRGRGLELLFDAFRLLVEDAPEAKLLIVGEGDLRSFYAEYARKLGVDGKTVFAGAVSRERMPEYYSACDVFVFPSLFNEPFGLSLLEAMACGKPVVGSKVGGLPYVVGDAGVLVPPNDVNALYGVLKKFLLDGDYAREVGARCLDRAKSKFAWNVVLTEYGNLYAKVLSEG